MRNKCAIVVLLALGMATIGGVVTRTAAQQQAAGITLDADDIGGVVTSAKGPEAGVWVIAETKDFPTTFARIVVTDDQGRYAVPDLPKANYNVWVRGYGLVDSRKVQSAPGKILNLTAVLAPNPQAAAEYYPANYWFSLVAIPPASAFPMEREGFRNQLEWISAMKGAIQFTQLGDKATRRIPEKLGRFKSSKEAWTAWTLSGESPVNVRRMGQAGIDMYADWTDRIAAGEVPQAPPRPQGEERSAVVTLWDWSNDKAFIHDVMTTDSRKPTVNPYGPIYGPEQFSSDDIIALDPVKNSWVRIPQPVKDKDMQKNYVDYNMGMQGKPSAPLVWGDEEVRPAVMRLHNSMMDHLGRLWTTGRFRKNENQPDFCKAGSNHPSAKLYPLNTNTGIQLLVYDPKTKTNEMVDTCFATMHLEFAEDADHTVWNTGGNQVIGYFKTKVWDDTKDIAKAQGWCPYVLDTNGNGKLDTGWVEPAGGGGRANAEGAAQAAVDPTRDYRIRGGSYGIGYNPVDGTIWLGTGGYPGFILRVNPGTNPPSTCLTEVYNSPAGAGNPKGVYAERESGLIWVAFAATNQFASFDRKKCKVTNGPTATGNHCPEGWTLYPVPGPKFKNALDNVQTDWFYLNWVDQFDFLGLGKDTPVAPGTNSDSMIALNKKTGKFVTMRVPYPRGFFSRGVDGRIDDPAAGWKGKGLYTTYASISPWNQEGGKGEGGSGDGVVPKVVKFQIRPNPLAH